MPVIDCPNCQTPIRVPTDAVAGTVACPDCGKKLRIAGSQESTASRHDEPREERRSGASPVLVLYGLLAGMVVSSVVLAGWFVAGRAKKQEVVVVQSPWKKSEKGPRTFAQLDPVKEGKDPIDPVTNKKDKEKDGGKVEENGKEKDKGPVVARKEMSEKEIYEYLLKSVAWVRTERGEGSGSIIDLEQRLVLTNEHVANQTSEIVVVQFPAYRLGNLVTERKEYDAQLKKGENRFRAKVVFVDRTADLCLLQLEQRPPSRSMAVPLASRSVGPLSKVYTVGGCPKGNELVWISTAGQVRQVGFESWRYEDGFPRAAVVVASSAPINPGDSGGGLIDAHGAYVGTNAAKKQGDANTRHIDVTVVVDFLRRYFKQTGKDWQPPTEAEPPVDIVKQLDELQKELAEAKPETRQAAAQKLGRLGGDARKAVPGLLKLVRDTRQPEAVRKSAILALDEIGPPPAEGIADLMEALKDGNSTEARRYAARSLGRFDAKGKEIVEALVGSLRDKDAEVRLRAVLSLGTFGPSALEAGQKPALALLNDDDIKIRQAGLQALFRMGKPGTIDEAQNRTLLLDKAAKAEPRTYALFLLLLAGEDNLPTVASVLTPETDAVVAVEAASALPFYKVRNKDVGLALSRGLDHKSRAVRVESVNALGRLGYDAPLFPAYLKALCDGDVNVRALAANRLPVMGTFVKKGPVPGADKESMPAIESALKHSEPLARLLGSFALGQMGKDGASGAPALLVALKKEQNRFVRMEMLAALSAIGPAVLDGKVDSDELLGDLLNIARSTRDEERPAQTCAALALASIAPKSEQGKQALGLLARGLLRKPDPTDPDQQFGGLFGRPRKGAFGGFGGLSTQPNPGRKQDPVIEEIHERAKETIVKAGVDGASALASAHETTFTGNKADDAALATAKKDARKLTFELLGTIGPEARKSKPVMTRLQLTATWAKKNNEFPDVIDAAKEAARSMNLDPRKVGFP